MGLVTGLVGAAGATVGLAMLVALLAVGGVGLAARRWRGVGEVVVPVAVLAGWVVLVPRFGAWLRPVGPAEHLVMPAAVLVGVALLRGRVGPRAVRWLAVAGAWFGAWWVAGVAGAEFWRALAAGLVLSLVLGWRRDTLAAGAAVLWGGLVLAGAPGVLAGVAAVLLAAFVAGGAGTPLALAIVVAEVGAGRLVRGRVGPLEVACAAAVAAPFVAGWLERLVARRGVRRPWLARGVGVAGSACLGVGVAWAVGRLGRP